MYHDYILRWDCEPIDYFSDSTAASVHKRQRLYKCDPLALNRAVTNLIIGFFPELQVLPVGQLLQNQKADIMACLGIAATRVSKSDQEPQILFLLFLCPFLFLFPFLYHFRLGRCSGLGSNRLSSDRRRFNDSRDNSDYNVIKIGKDLDAFFKTKITYMNRLADFKFGNINNRLSGYLIGKTFYHDFSERMLENTAIPPDADGLADRGYMYRYPYFLSE